MYAWIDKNTNIADREKKSIILPNIRSYIAALLMLTPSLQAKSSDPITTEQEKYIWIYQKNDPMEKNKESMSSYEMMFKDGIQKTINTIGAINQIPIWWKHITYYRDEWALKWEKLIPESIRILKLPEKFDISPRTITKPVASILFHLGERKFSIKPDIGKIKDIYLTPKELIIETTLLFNISYDKQIRLPDLMYKLWMTPIGKWEKIWFRWTTVVEI